MRKRFWIYMITNLVTNKIYIGQTCDFSKRKSAHKLSTDGDTYIKRSILKYGWEKHKMEVLHYTENISYEDGNILEIEYIKKFKSCRYENKMGMNLNYGGNCGVKFEDQIKKMVISKFYSWKNKIGKKDVGIEVYLKTGVHLFTHYGNHIEFIEKLGLDPSNKSKWALVQKHLQSGGMICMKKYIIQWKGENRFELIAKEKIRRGLDTSKRFKGVTPIGSMKVCQKIILDTQTGIYYIGLKEFSAHLEIDKDKAKWRINNNFYKGRYIA